MIHSESLLRNKRAQVLALAAACVLSGCESKFDKAVDEAKKKAASSGQAQQVLAVDDRGSTTTAVVQPPVPGQKNQSVTTTVTPPPPGGSPPPASDPRVFPLTVQPTAGQASQPESATQVPPAPPLAGQSTPPAAAGSGAEMTIPAGTILAIQINREINVKKAHKGDRFTGMITEPVPGQDGSVVIPTSTPVTGVVAAAKKRWLFRNTSELDLRLTSITLNGTVHRLKIADPKKHKQVKGKPGAGDPAVGLKNKRVDVVVHAESIVHFKLDGKLVLPL